MKYVISIFTFALLLMMANTNPVQAGEPTGEIGPMNPTMFKCVTKGGSEEETSETGEIISSKPVASGEVIELDAINEIINNDPTTENSNCTSNFDIISDFGFNTTDAEEFKAFLKKAERECNKKGGRLVTVADTRIDGIVYEFHPTNPADPEGAEWRGVRSRDVPVVARGITFVIEWGSEKDGTFLFQNLGAGPIVLNLRLPPDAHPINPNLIVKSTGLAETRTVILAFYRGDYPPPKFSQMRTEEGNPLPFVSDEDIVLANNCGLAMPNVGGILPQDKPISILILAAMILVTLPTVGLLKLRQNRSGS